MRVVSPLVVVASLAGVALFAQLQGEHDVTRGPPDTHAPSLDTPPIVPAVSPEPRRTFVPQSPQFAETEARTSAATGKADGTEPLAAAPGPLSAPVPAKRTALSTWSTVVTTNPAAQPKARPTPARDGGLARYELARDLQRELKRAGCYYGDVDGDWGPGSKRAMTEFADRVNASLPVEEPDMVLLALVEAHAGQVCGRTCPTGQGLDGEGRCLPRAILAQSEKKGPDRQKRAETIERERKAALERLARVGERAQAAGADARTAANTPPPLPGRMSVGASYTDQGANSTPSVTGSDPGRAVAPAEAAAGPPGETSQKAPEANASEPEPTAAAKPAKRARAPQKPPRYAEREAPRQQRTLIYNLFQRIDRVN